MIWHGSTGYPLWAREGLEAVGAVYDRAFGPFACESCAVIDRAYSKNDDVRRTRIRTPKNR